MKRVERIEGLYGIVDEGFRPQVPMAQKLRVFLEAGASVVQVRMKDASARQLWETARAGREFVAGRALLIVNDRPDVALAAGADGVHVGDEDLPVAEVRRFVGPDFVVGATVRTLEQARAAAREGADYVGFGPVYPTATKAVDAPARGLAMLAEVSRGAGVPVVAIAGVTAERAEEIARAGAAAAAVVSDVLGAADPLARARALQAAFAAGRAAFERSR